MINTLIIQYITYLHSLVTALMVIVFGKGFTSLPDEKPTKKEYRKMQVDDLPIFQEPQKLNYKEVLTNYFNEHGKELKPVKSRKGKMATPSSLICPICNAPHNYIYDNNGGRGQYLCKVCSTTFKPNNYRLAVKLKCPHCSKTLSKIKERKDFIIHKCKNDDCSYYKHNLNSMTAEEKKVI